jgi:hypothetical protein
MSEAIAVSVKFDTNLSKLFEQAALKAPYAVGRAIDEVGNKTKTQVIRAVAKQVPTKVGRVRHAVSSRLAMGGGQGQYVIIARDVTLSRKEFSPRKTAGGISVMTATRGRIVLKGSFFGPGEHVYERTTKDGKTKRGPRPTHSQLPIKKLWGTSIPKEMVKGEAEATFYRNVEQMLSPAIEKWLLRQIGK